MIEETPRLRFFVFGPLRATRGDSEVNIGGPRQRVMLAAFLLSANQPVSVDRLMHILWGDDSDDRRSTLHVYIAKLRKSLDAPGAERSVIETVRPGYRVSVDAETLDLLEFSELVQKGRQAMGRGDDATAARELKQAIRIADGPLLPDLRDYDFVNDQVAGFERTRTAAAADAYERELRLGHHREIVADLEGLISEHPFDERLHGLLMTSLYRAGRQVDALATYRRLRESLAEELGIEPDPELEALELQILNHDPALIGALPAARFDVAPQTLPRSSRTASTAVLAIGNRRVPIERAVTTIGRLPGQTVVIEDPDVSRRHAEIRRDPDGYTLVDVGSTNGTNLNGARVVATRLADGDEIKVGGTTLRFHDE